MEGTPDVWSASWDRPTLGLLRFSIVKTSDSSLRVENVNKDTDENMLSIVLHQ